MVNEVNQPPVVRQIGDNGRWSVIHRYAFTDGAKDDIGGQDGTLMNGATITNGALVLNGAGQYLTLPGGLITGLETVTFEFGASFGHNGPWCRLYDFGDQNAFGEGRYYVMFTPHSGDGDYLISYAWGDPGYLNQSVVRNSVPANLDNLGLLHIVCEYEPSTGFMGFFTNGVLAASVTNQRGPLSNIHNVHSWLGRSLYHGDAYLNGTITEFRIYAGRLTLPELRTNYLRGPDVVPSAGFSGQYCRD